MAMFSTVEILFLGEGGGAEEDCTCWQSTVPDVNSKYQSRKFNYLYFTWQPTFMH